MLHRDGIHLSISMVGRILGRLRATGELREPAHRRVSVRGRLWSRPHAVRTPRGHVALRPGDLVELDTFDVRFPGLVLKQFIARDIVSRWDVLEIAPSAASRNALAALDAILARMPFPVQAISVDNGSEFMAGFEAACAEREIPLYLLPPRSPKLHARVERANQTHTEEFHEVADAEPDLAHLAPALRAWEDTYNRVRPHQSLAYLTPAEYLASLGIVV